MVFEVPFTEAAIEGFSELKVQRDGFVAWVEAASDQFQSMQEGWLYSGLAEKCAELKNMANAIVKRQPDSWNSDIRVLAESLGKLVPPKQLSNNARILTDNSLRNSFGLTVTKLFKSPEYARASDFAKLVARAAEMNIQLSAVKSLNNARRSARLSICLNWVLDEILNFQPSCPMDFLKHTAAVRDKLKQKGCKDS